MKPIIGVMPLWDEKKDSIWMLPGYMDGVSQAGGIPIILPLSDDKNEISQLVDICDGLLFTGGQDVSPYIYNEEPLNETTSCCEKRDSMELLVLNLAISSDIPVLGICRGIQFINAALGGTLYQDIPLQYSILTKHHQNPPYDIPAHNVNIETDSPLFDLLKTKVLPVNSYHHQAVKKVADELKIMAVADDGLVEALYMPKHKFLWALQWHPEFSYKSDMASQKIFKAFIDSMK